MDVVTELPISTSTRSCVGCGQRASSDALVRLVLVEGDPSGVVPDAKGGAFGRGAHVHATRACLELACKKGLSRAFKREVRANPSTLAQSIAIAYARRLDGLLSGGVRGKHVEIGNDAVVEVLRAGRALVVLLACDAAAAATRSEVVRATGEGKVLVVGDRMSLARSLGRTSAEARDGVAICAVTHEGLADEIRTAWSCVFGLDAAKKSEENAE